MMRVSILVLVVCGLLACGSDEAAPGDFNALCTKNSDCDDGQGLLCIGAGVNRGICTNMCMSDAECAVHGSDTKCVGAGVSAGYCYQSCTDSGTCPRGHICDMSPLQAFGTCRAEN